MDWSEKLEWASKLLPGLMERPEVWQSLVINRRKPYTYRAFVQEGNHRICLHRFETCDEAEAFEHPHPWPGAFKILKGSYFMKVGYSKDRESSPVKVAEFVMAAGSSYAIEEPMTWHSITPLEECFTLMVNGEPWARDYAHNQVRTTKGKDLQSMSPTELQEHFEAFRRLI